MENIYENIYENLNENSSKNQSDDENILDKKYMEPTILQNINIDKYFTKEDIDKSIMNNIKLKITDKGLYSISKYQDAKWISEIIKNFLKGQNIDIKNETIIDSTAGIGGNSISFSKYLYFLIFACFKSLIFNSCCL